MTKATEPRPIVEVEGQALTPGDAFWLEVVRDAAKASPAALEEAAKQLIAIASLAQTLYFAAISFSEVKKSLDLLATGRRWAMIAALLIPVLLWLASLFFAARVFTPRSYETNFNAPDLARETWEAMAAHKHKNLRCALWLLASGFIPMLANLFVYLAFVPVAK